MSKSIQNTKTAQLSLIPESELMSPFERIKHTDENGNEFWFARELMRELSYSEWRWFKPVIEKAIQACIGSGNRVEDNFAENLEVILSKTLREQKSPSYKLSRYACYLIAINGDPSKSIIAQAQTYFVSQARKQEIANELKAKQAITEYQLRGKSEIWAGKRVTTKQTQKQLMTDAKTTHVTNTPDYRALAGVQNKELFDLSVVEIVAYLGLLPKDADNWRDYVSKYALETINITNDAASGRMKKLNRPLTTDEQLTIIRDAIRILAPAMRNLAEYEGQDFISGTDLDQNGKALINRNVKLLK